MVVFCHSRQEAEQVKAKLAAWLAPRGLLAGLAGTCAGLMAGQTRLARTDEVMVRSPLAEPVPGDATPIVPEPHLQAHRQSH
jgi:hypothetical protein